MSAPVIEFSEVTKTYRRPFAPAVAPALSEVSFEVAAGEACAFLGPNGAGKTTAMGILMGFIHADRGRSRVFGCRPGDARAKARIGFLPENFAFYRYLDAEHLLQFHLRLSGRRPSNAAELVHDLLARVQLEAHKGLKIGKYSRGMMQRLGVAQALLGAPDLLVLDEPTSGLDPAGRKDVRDLIMSLKAEGKTIFLSSHILAEVEQICDRVIIIDRGQIVRAGALREMLAAGTQVEIIVDDLPDVLDHALSERGAVVVRGAGRVQIMVDAVHKRALTEILWAGGCDVISLMPVKSSLEDIFLEQVGAGGPH